MVYEPQIEGAAASMLLNYHSLPPSIVAFQPFCQVAELQSISNPKFKI
jgi:hypothetical protein